MFVGALSRRRAYAGVLCGRLLLCCGVEGVLCGRLLVGSMRPRPATGDWGSLDGVECVFSGCTVYSTGSVRAREQSKSTESSSSAALAWEAGVGNSRPESSTERERPLAC